MLHSLRVLLMQVLENWSKDLVHLVIEFAERTRLYVGFGDDVLTGSDSDATGEYWDWIRKRWQPAEFVEFPSAGPLLLRAFTRVAKCRWSASCMIGADFIMLGGYSSEDGKALDTISTWSLTKKEWVPRCGTMPCARYHHQVVVDGYWIYIIGGLDTNGRCVQKLDAIHWKDGTGQRRKEGTRQRRRAAKVQRRDFAAVFHKNGIYIIGGIDDVFPPAFMRIETTRRGRSEAKEKVKTLSQPPIITRACSAILFDDQLWVTGGVKPSGRPGVPTNYVQVYDFDADRWTMMPPLLRPRRDHLMCL